MNARTTALLLGVALLLFAFLWFYEIRGAPARDAARASERRVFPEVRADEITELASTGPDGQTVTAARTADGWRITMPVDFPGVASAFDAMAKSLSEMEREERIETPAARDVYGLGGTARVVHFLVGKERRVLTIGRATPVGANVYVSTGAPDDPDAPVDIVSEARVRAFDRTFGQLRDGRVLAFDPAAVDRISLFLRIEGRNAAQRSSVVLERRDETWRITAPAELESDDAAVSRLLESLRTLQAYGFSDAPLADAETGLDAPTYRVELGVGTGTFGFLVGAPVPRTETAPDDPSAGAPPALRYVRAAEMSLYLVPEARIAALPHDAFALRWKQLARFAPEEARALELVFAAAGTPADRPTVADEPDRPTLADDADKPTLADDADRPTLADQEPVRVELVADGSWQLDGAAADAASVRELIAALANLEAVGVAADGLGPHEQRALGLDPARLHVRVLGASDALLADIKLGETAGDGRILATRSGRSEIFELPSAFAEQLGVTRRAFIERLTR